MPHAFRHALAIAAIAAIALPAVLPAAAQAADPDLTVPAADLAAALDCPDTFTDADHEPVLLVHGTYTNAQENWAWNYGAYLPSQGYDVCYVTLPGRSLDDIQIASEYVVHAIREMHARSGERVDIIGHSQGVLEPRWALRWWPSLRDQVDDLVGLAGPNHGTAVADVACATGDCPAAAMQMRTTSEFIRLLNSEDESPGEVSYTSLFSLTDELVQPAAPTPTAAFEGAANVLLQDICPGRPVDHLGIASDAVAFALTMDALTNEGPADPSRLAATVCTGTVMPGATPAPFLSSEALALFLESQAFPETGDEPEAAAYADAGAPAPQPDPAPDPDPAPAPDRAPGLPATGGGLALGGMLALVTSRRLARHR